MTLDKDKKSSVRDWVSNGEPFIWINAAAVSISVVAVIGILLLLAVRGFGHFWPANVLEANYTQPGQLAQRIIGEVVETETIPVEQLLSAGVTIETDAVFIDRTLIKQGNRDVTGTDFVWVIEDFISDRQYPEALMVIERREWGNFYGYLTSIKQQGQLVDAEDNWAEFQRRIARALALHAKIENIEKGDIGTINYQLERLRLRERGMALNKDLTATERASDLADINADRAVLDQEYGLLQKQLACLLYTSPSPRDRTRSRMPSSA